MLTNSFTFTCTLKHTHTHTPRIQATYLSTDLGISCSLLGAGLCASSLSYKEMKINSSLFRNTLEEEASLVIL